MVEILQYLKILEISYLGHAEHHSKNRTSLCGLDQKTLFFDLPLILCFLLCSQWPSEILLFTLYTRISQNQKTCSVFLFIEFSVISTTADSVNAKAFVTC